MSQSLARNLIHLIFSTKHRQLSLTDAVRPALHAYTVGIIADQHCYAVAINSVTDHMHILFELHKTLALATAIQHIKQGSSRWLKTQSPDFKTFEWQNGYGAFSVSASNIPTVTEYIANQLQHHAKQSFQDELRAFLKRHNVPFDEKYLWD
jgi:putative transposase